VVLMSTPIPPPGILSLLAKYHVLILSPGDLGVICFFLEQVTRLHFILSENDNPDYTPFKSLKTVIDKEKTDYIPFQRLNRAYKYGKFILKWTAAPHTFLW